MKFVPAASLHRPARVLLDYVLQTLIPGPVHLNHLCLVLLGPRPGPTGLSIAVVACHMDKSTQQKLNPPSDHQSHPLNMNISDDNLGQGGLHNEGISSSRGEREALWLLHWKSSFPRDPKRWPDRRGGLERGGKHGRGCQSTAEEWEWKDATKRDIEMLVK